MALEHDFGVRPLFYDALSGEFLPPSDNIGRAHTLGRLTVAACSKGLRAPGQFLSGSHIPKNLGHRPVNTYTYQPPWANVEVVVAKQTIGVGFVEGLQVHSLDTGETFAVYDTIDPSASTQRGIRIVDDSVRFMQIELGAMLDDARSAVVQTAQQFFDSIT